MPGVLSAPGCPTIANTNAGCWTCRGKAGRFTCAAPGAFVAATPSARGKSSPSAGPGFGPWARETAHLCEVVGVFGYALGGLPGARLLKRLGMDRGPDTVLRRVKGRQSGGSPASIRVLGVDDWAWHKHQSYGTMLMDLERGRVIDLLPDRSAHSFARWLEDHPEVAVVTRDRSGLYADGARQGAPGAAQVTDRYHLVSNLSEAVERDVQQLQINARAQLALQSETPSARTAGERNSH